MRGRPYRTLQAISSVLRALAWVVGVGGLLVSLGALVFAAVRAEPEGLIVAMMAAIYGVFGFVYLYAAAGVIVVVLDIEDNTRRTAEALEVLARAQGGSVPPLA